MLNIRGMDFFWVGRGGGWIACQGAVNDSLVLLVCLSLLEVNISPQDLRVDDKVPRRRRVLLELLVLYAPLTAFFFLQRSHRFQS